MTPEEEAHWRYTLEVTTSWGYHERHVISPFDNVPAEVAWLREQARYKGHLATALLRRQAAERGEVVL